MRPTAGGRGKIIITSLLSRLSNRRWATGNRMRSPVPAGKEVLLDFLLAVPLARWGGGQEPY